MNNNNNVQMQPVWKTKTNKKINETTKQKQTPPIPATKHKETKPYRLNLFSA